MENKQLDQGPQFSCYATAKKEPISERWNKNTIQILDLNIEQFCQNTTLLIMLMKVHGMRIGLPNNTLSK